MEKNINIIIEDLKQQLVKDINDSNLPIGVINLIVNDLQWKVEKTYYAQLNSSVVKEFQQEDQATEEKEEESE